MVYATIVWQKKEIENEVNLCYWSSVWVTSQGGEPLPEQPVLWVH